MKPDLSVLILTFNEERHIQRAVESAFCVAKEVFVVDSFSNDRTVEIAESLGARVFQHTFRYHAAQLNWAIENLPVSTEWIFRLDADEYFTDELIDEIKETLPKTTSNINGFTAPRLMYFMGKYIRHGILPMIILRLWRTGKARCENKKMDEHIMLTEGKVGTLQGAFIDDSKITLAEWIQKHNAYSDNEAMDLLCTEYNIGGIDNTSTTKIGDHTSSKRKKKLKYIKLPLFWRSFAFFVYRYFIRCGFLDGKEGFLWHFLQGFWYRSLADAKVFEIKKRFGFDKERIKAYLTENFINN